MHSFGWRNFSRRKITIKNGSARLQLLQLIRSYYMTARQMRVDIYLDYPYLRQISLVRRVDDCIHLLPTCVNNTTSLKASPSVVRDMFFIIHHKT